MAKVTLQVDVKREQVDKLQADINKLKSTKITISTRESNKELQQTQKTLQQFEKTQQQMAKTEQEIAKARERVAKADAAEAKAEKERNSATVEGERATQAALKTERDREKNLQEQQKTQREQIKTEREAAKQVRESAKEASASAKSTQELSNAQEKQSKVIDFLGRSFSSFVKRMIAYRGVYAAIRAVTNGITEALQTMKAVDDELVTVRKVTGFDQYQMANVESQAYEVASRYGVNASDYVAGVAEFARAGYKELSGELAELAQKTMIVGDTTADVANQFLLSVDAAYKYKGNVEALTRVLDGANEIDNKYATSIEKIAEGMGIVAPVAAQMHVGVDELAASIGTITAVTQRSGKLFLAA